MNAVENTPPFPAVENGPAVPANESGPPLSNVENGPALLSEARPPCWLFDVPFMPLVLDEAAEEMERLIHRNVPSYIITANVNYAMLVDRNPDLHEVNRKAAAIIADGAPIVRLSRLTSRPLPERVTGQDLVARFCELAARKGHRMFFLGAAPGVAEQAARRLCERHPGLQIVGTEAPMLKDLTPEEHEALIARIRAARPDVLLVAFGQPLGERWIHQNYETLGVPVSIQVGCTLDCAAGVVPRAPRWMQHAGLEAVFRWSKEPFRLTPRYGRNALFLARSIARFAFSPEYRRQDRDFADGACS